VTVNSTPLIQTLRRPRERIVDGMVGLVCLSSGWEAYEVGFLQTQFAARLTAVAPQDLVRLLRFLRTFLQAGKA
jgi:hypothetical protein